MGGFMNRGDGNNGSFEGKIVYVCAGMCVCMSVCVVCVPDYPF